MRLTGISAITLLFAAGSFSVGAEEAQTVNQQQYGEIAHSAKASLSAISNQTDWAPLLQSWQALPVIEREARLYYFAAEARDLSYSNALAETLQSLSEQHAVSVFLSEDHGRAIPLTAFNYPAAARGALRWHTSQQELAQMKHKFAVRGWEAFDGVGDAAQIRFLNSLPASALLKADISVSGYLSDKALAQLASVTGKPGFYSALWNRGDSAAVFAAIHGLSLGGSRSEAPLFAAMQHSELKSAAINALGDLPRSAAISGALKKGFADETHASDFAAAFSKQLGGDDIRWLDNTLNNGSGIAQKMSALSLWLNGGNEATAILKSFANNKQQGVQNSELKTEIASWLK